MAMGTACHSILMLAWTLTGASPLLAAGAVLSPKTSTILTSLPLGQRLDYCPQRNMSGPIPLEWEVRIDAEIPASVIYRNVVSDGANGGHLTLRCPPTSLPPGSSLLACDATSGTLEVQVPVTACSSVRLRYETIVNSTAPPFSWLCDGGEIDDGTATRRTVPPQASPLPQPPPSPSAADDTCLYLIATCGVPESYNWRLFHAVDSPRGAVPLPGDAFLFRSQLDFRYLDLVPSVAMTSLNFNFDSTTTFPVALPDGLELDTWLTTPLAPAADYVYDPSTRILAVVDPDPTAPPEVTLTAGTVIDLGAWNGHLACNARAGAPLCLFGQMRHPGGWMYSEDPTEVNGFASPTCVTPLLPDFRGSVKSVSACTAEPGDDVEFRIDLVHDFACPPGAPPCACAATAIEILDVVDLTKLDNVVPLDGGTLIAPDTIRWTLPALEAGATSRVRFQARVRLDTMYGDQVCNRASVTSAERKSVADGGLLTGCASFPPVEVALSPCLAIELAGSPPPRVTGVQLTREAPGGIRLRWDTSAPGANAYRVCYFEDWATRDRVPTPCAGKTIVCDGVMIGECLHSGALPGNPSSPSYYQVRGLCGMLEGP